MTDSNKVLDSYLDAQLQEMGKAAIQLAHTMWAYYVALKGQGFGDLQAVQLCKSFQEAIIGTSKSD